MRVVHVASEVTPWAQTGGLSDVVGALPAALTHVASEVRTATVAPLYRAARARVAAAGLTLGDGFAAELSLGGHHLHVRLRPVGPDAAARVWLLECDPLYDRDGFYEQPGGGDWPDNPLRFAALARAAVDLAPAVLGGPPDIIHAHDWQAGLAPAYARWAGSPAATLLTVHNLAYRGVFGKHVMDTLGLPWSAFDLHHLEFWDQVSFLKAGMAYADVVSTVSPTYAQEILTPARGEGLDGFLRSDVARVVGIVNGIDTGSWDPASDPALPERFTRDALAGKAACRAALAREVGLLPLDERTPLAVAIARMTSQKGLDLLADLVPELRQLGVKLVVLGAGEAGIEDRWRWLASAFSHDVAVRIGFDPALSRRLYAGADLFIMPSRFEPCGLGQLYAMRYGAVPVVAAVGGLRDTVIDAPWGTGGHGELAGDAPHGAGAGTGFRFDHVDVGGLRWALTRATRMFRDAPATFAAVRAQAMARDSSWDVSAREYLQVYRAAIRARS